MKLRALTLSLFALALLCVPHGARAQGVVGVSNCLGTAVGAGLGSVLTVDKNTGYLCTSASATGTFTDDATGATGSAVPVSGSYTALNIGGTLRGWTGVNPSGTIYAGYVYLADGYNVTLGTKADVATCATTNTVLACLRQIDADVTGAIPAGTNIIGQVQVAGNSYTNITTATTTTAKSGAGVLHTICVNSLGTVSSSTTVYDNTSGSGTKIAALNTLALLGCQTYDVVFSTGLTLVTTGTVAPDVTVSWR